MTEILWSEEPCYWDTDAIVEYDGCSYPDLGSAFVTGVLGFCGCGSPELILDDVMRYYRAILKPRLEKTGRPWPDTNDRLTAWVEYSLDRAELTEHGGSVSGAWLTDKGREWFARIEAVWGDTGDER